MGKGQEAAGNTLEAKKQYLFAKNLYKELKLDDKVVEVDGLIEVLETAMEQEKAETESLEAEEAEKERQPKETENNAGSPTNPGEEIGPGIPVTQSLAA